MREADAAALLLVQSGGKSAFVLSDGSSYSNGLARQFTAAAQKHSLKIVGTITESPSSESSTSEIALAHPDAVFYAPSSVTQAADFANALAQAGVHIDVYSSDTALSDQFIERLGTSAEQNPWYVVFNGWSTVDEAKWQQFSADFQAKFGKAPTQYAANAYDAANLVLDALTNAQGNSPNRDEVINYVLHRANYSGLAARSLLTTVVTWGPGR